MCAGWDLPEAGPLRDSALERRLQIRKPGGRAGKHQWYGRRDARMAASGLRAFEELLPAIHDVARSGIAAYGVKAANRSLGAASSGMLERISSTRKRGTCRGWVRFAVTSGFHKNERSRRLDHTMDCFHHIIQCRGVRRYRRPPGSAVDCRRDAGMGDLDAEVAGLFPPPPADRYLWTMEIIAASRLTMWRQEKGRTQAVVVSR